MVAEKIEAEVQRMLEEEGEMLLTGMTELRSLRILLQEQKDFNATLEDQLKNAKASQMAIQRLLTRMEQQVQQQFEKLSATRNQMFRKDANNTKSSGGSSYHGNELEPVDECHETTYIDSMLTEDVQIISSDDEYEHHSNEADRFNRKGKSDSGQMGARKLLNVQILCDRKSVITQSDDEGDVDAESNDHFEKVSSNLSPIYPSKDNSEQSEKEGTVEKKQVRSGRKTNWKKVGKPSSAKVVQKPGTHFCQECNKRFSCKSQLTRHLRIHNGEKPFKCKICDKSFSQRNNVISHSRIHTGERPYKCEVCNRFFGFKSTLAKHLMLHISEKPFKCKICDKSFSQRSTLISHSRIHTGEKPYKCELCNRLFSLKSNLAQHLMIHVDEKPFECDICKKTFRQKFTLSEHMNIHSGRRPYTCKKCKTTFRYYGGFSKHVKLHVGQ